jgi:hypothetical protein
MSCRLADGQQVPALKMNLKSYIMAITTVFTD